jgi:phosphatidylinositol glycan class V
VEPRSDGFYTSIGAACSHATIEMASRRPSTRLFQAFFAWKSVLFIVAALSPGPGYDTSALIASNPSSSRHVDFQSWSAKDRVSLNSFRWDALYFVKSAQRGYHYEQEWAFSWAYSLLLRTLVKRTNDPNTSLRDIDPSSCIWKPFGFVAKLCLGWNHCL